MQYEFLYLLTFFSIYIQIHSPIQQKGKKKSYKNVYLYQLLPFFAVLSPQLCETALALGYLPVVFNRRSHNNTPLTTVRLQQFGDPADLREAVRYIRYRQPAGRLYAVSESSGSGLLLSYLGECGSSSYVTAAVCLSPVFRCQSWFESGLCWPLQWVLVLYQRICLSR